jgi:hypothetical protein
LGVIVGVPLSQDHRTSGFPARKLFVRELDLRGRKMGGFESVKLYVLRLWPVASNGISSVGISGSATNGGTYLKTL